MRFPGLELSPQMTLNAGAAAAAGLAAGFLALLLMMALLILQPRRFPLNPLYLTGAVFSINATTAYIAGLVVILAVAAGYGVVIAAVFEGFELTSALPLWGAVIGGVLSIITGTSTAYLRVLSPAVRNGLLGDPGPFLISYGRWPVAELFASHVLFGLITGALYTLMV